MEIHFKSLVESSFSQSNFPLQAFCDLEPIFSYEGTYDINSLVTGRDITGIASFKPAMVAKSRM